MIPLDMILLASKSLNRCKEHNLRSISKLFGIGYCLRFLIPFLVFIPKANAQSAAGSYCTRASSIADCLFTYVSEYYVPADSRSFLNTPLESRHLFSIGSATYSGPWTLIPLTSPPYENTIWFSIYPTKQQIEIKDGIPIVVSIETFNEDFFVYRANFVVNVPDWVERIDVSGSEFSKPESGNWNDFNIPDASQFFGPDTLMIDCPHPYDSYADKMYASRTITFYSGCSSCTQNSGQAQAAPSIHTSGSGGPILSAPLSVGSDCCSGTDTPHASWHPSSFANALNPASIQVYLPAAAVASGQSSRYPSDRMSPVSQILTDSVLSVSSSTADMLSWKNYNAATIDDRPNPQSPFPLTMNNGAGLLPLLSETRLTRETATSILFERFEGGFVVGRFRLTDTTNTTTGIRLMEKENLLAGEKESVSTKDLTPTLRRTATRIYRRNGNGPWAQISGTYTKESIVPGVELLMEEGVCGTADDGSADEWDNRYGYWTDNRLKYREGANGFWEFRDGTTTYGPYQDTPFPGATWTPSSTPSLAGIRSEVIGIGGITTSYVGLTQVGQTANWRSSDEYTVAVNSTRGGFTSTTISTTSQAPPKVFQSLTLREDDGRGLTTLHQYTRGYVDSSGFHSSVTGEHLLELVSTSSSVNVPELLLFDQPLILDPVTIGAVFTGASGQSS